MDKWCEFKKAKGGECSGIVYWQDSEAQRIERRRPKPKAVGSSPITRSSFATKSRLVQRKNACLTSKLRGFDSCTRHQFEFVSRDSSVGRARDR